MKAATKERSQLGRLVRNLCLASISLLGLFWLLDLPLKLQLPVMEEQFILVIAGLATAAGFLQKPLRLQVCAAEIVLALLAMVAWSWAAFRYEDWLINAAHRSPEQWLPGGIGLLLLLEATRRNCGNGIAAVIGLFALYGLVGHFLPGLAEAQYSEPRRLIGYLYVDTNGHHRACLHLFLPLPEHDRCGQVFRRIIARSTWSLPGRPGKSGSRLIQLVRAD